MLESREVLYIHCDKGLGRSTLGPRFTLPSLYRYPCHFPHRSPCHLALGLGLGLGLVSIGVGAMAQICTVPASPTTRGVAVCACLLAHLYGLSATDALSRLQLHQACREVAQP